MRFDIEALFNSEFDRNEQLSLVASTLEHLRNTYPAKWQLLGQGARIPEFKALIRGLVRVADESVDHRATVAYVTKAALNDLKATAILRGAKRMTKGALSDSEKFNHEHATPVEVILRTITLPENQQVPMVKMLDALCCRVLVTSAERVKIDNEHAWTVPASLEWKKGLSLGLRTLDPSFIPLIRYHKVDPELALSLIPLSSARKSLHEQFCNLMSASNFEDLMCAYRACKRKPDTSFVLSDDIYRGTARMKFGE